MADKIITEKDFIEKYLNNRYVIASRTSIQLAKKEKSKYLTVLVHSKKNGIFDITHILVELNYHGN
jgi:hypothetical protein